MMYVADALWPLWIILLAAAIGLTVFLLRKFVPGLATPNEPIDEKKQAEEDVNRVIMQDTESVSEKEKKDTDEEEDNE